MTIEAEKAYCLFYSEYGESGFGAGCTKEWLDSKGGDPSKLFADMSSDDYSPVFMDLTGFNAIYDPEFGIVDINNSPDLSELLEPGMLAYVEGTGFAGKYEILAVGTQTIKINTNLCDPGEHFVYLCVGGAFDELQSPLDDADASKFDCWVFFNSDVNDYDLSISSGSDGSYLNNTSLYIVGYNRNCYDCLPAGHEYWDDDTLQIGDGQYYKSAIDWRKTCTGGFIPNKNALSVLPKAYYKNSTKYIFTLDNVVENVVFMGINYESDQDYVGGLIKLEGAENRSISINHCVLRNDQFENQLAADDLAGKGYWVCCATSSGFGSLKLYDCCNLGGSDNSLYAATISDLLEISHCVYDSAIVGSTCGQGTALKHHNKIIRCRWDSSSDYESHVISHNNIFYKHRRAVILANGTSGSVGIIDFYNNIVQMHPEWTVQSYYAFIYVQSGGTINEDYNCIRDWDDTPTLYMNDDDSTNADWVNKGIGANSIEVDPMFVDPDNFDFRPRNPKVITGGKPINGVATYMGAVPTKHIKSNARTANFGRMNIIKC
jgi:hypothetical protein